MKARILNNSSRVKIVETRTELYKLNSNFKWICSGTPFGNLKDLKEVLNYVCNIECVSYYRHIFNMLLNMIFRRNTKDSVKEQVCIPPINIDTEFLNMSSLERLIYDSALDNKDKKIELCNHIMVSEEHLNILGNEPLTLEEIKEKMTLHYKNKIDRYEKRINNLELEISSNNSTQDLMDKLQNYKNNLNDYKAKYNIFTQLEEKINDDDTCPICLEELKDLTTSITPCGHIFCSGCLIKSNNTNHMSKNKCPMCRFNYRVEEIKSIKPSNINTNKNEPQIGTKIERLLDYINTIINKNNKEKIIVFSQWDNMLKLVSKFLYTHNVNNIILNGSIHTISSKIRNFKLDDSLNVVLMSSDKSPSGLTLTDILHILYY